MRTKILDLAQEIDKELEEREKHEKELEIRLISLKIMLTIWKNK